MGRVSLAMLFLTYPSLVPAQTRVLVDRELNLPAEWIGDLRDAARRACPTR